MIKIEIGGSEKGDRGMINRFKSTMALFISILAIVVVFVPYIFPSYSCCARVDMSTDLMVAILAVIVTILIGWNLYSAIRIDERVDFLAKKVEEYEKVLCERKKEYEEFKNEVSEDVEKASKTAMILSLAQGGMAFYNTSCNEGYGENRNYAQAVQLLFNAQSLIQDVNVKVDEIYDEANSHSIQILKKIAKIEGLVLCVDDENEKEMFVETAKQIGDDDIIKMARSAKVRREDEA